MSSTASSPLDVVSANGAESKAIVAKCGERVEKYNTHLQAGERINDRWRALIGLELALAKPHLDHGEFEPFVQQRLPQYNKRTAERWMEFAELVISKSDPGSLLKQLPAKAMDGGIADRELALIDAELRQLTGDAAFDDFIAANAPKKPKGGLRNIKFHCPHCSTENKGLFGREVKCVNGACGKKITAKPDVDPDKELQRLRKEASDDLDSYSDACVLARERAMSAEKSSPLNYFAVADRKALFRAQQEHKLMGARLAEAAKLMDRKGAKQ